MTIEQINEVSELVYKVNQGKAFIFFTQGKFGSYISIHNTITGMKINHSGYGCVQFDDYVTIVKVLTKMIQKMEA